MHYEAIRKHLSDYFTEAIKLKKARMPETGRLTKDEINYYGDGVAYGSSGFALELKGDPQLTSFFKWSGLNVSAGSKDYETIRTEYEGAYSSFCQHLLDYDRSLSAYDFGEASSVETLANAPNSATLAEVIKLFVDEQLGVAKAWGKKTELDKRQHFEVLQEVLGSEIDIVDILAEQTRLVKSTLLKYPKNRNKLPKTKGLPLQEVLALENVERLSTKTINQYLQSYSGLFAWAKRQSYIGTNFFEGLAIKAKKQEVDMRNAFSPEQIQLMLSEIISNGRGLIKKDYQKWGPLIAIYTGARLNEIAQLGLVDFKQENELHYIDLNEGSDDKRLKNAASKRKVPIHSALLKKGLLQYVNQLRADGKKKLFPDFPFSPKTGYGRNLGHWFNVVFLPELGLKTKQLVFHSLRHSMITQLMHRDTPEAIVKAIVGHARVGVTQQHYFKQGYTLEQLALALDKLKW